MITSAAFVLLLVTQALAAPAANATCTVTDFSQVSAAVAACTDITLANITVPGGTTLDLTKLKAGTSVAFTGTTTFGFAEWVGPLVSVKGTDITVRGPGVLDGQGALYWDGLGGNGGITKPKFFAAHDMVNSTIEGLTIRNSPVQVFSVNGATNLTIAGVTVDDRAGDVLGHNTDGFDIGSSDQITIRDSVILNQDDCVAINSGTNVHVSGLYCSGGHGLSIGSVGGRSDNTVQNVTFAASAVVNSQNGVRIKTVYNATGTVANITYAGIALANISSFGVVIEQDYENGSPTGVPTPGVPITGLTLAGVAGAVAPGAKNYYILCAAGACDDWKFEGVYVVGGKNNSCNYKPTGFSC